ncbi:MAG: hypothetical protein AAFX65_10540 [Cyanobacteria bacterium J06638_7]
MATEYRYWIPCSLSGCATRSFGIEPYRIHPKTGRATKAGKAVVRIKLYDDMFGDSWTIASCLAAAITERLNAGLEYIGPNLIRADSLALPALVDDWFAGGGDD